MFQGAYKSKTITDDTYLRYVAAYVMVKNTFELYPEGGLQAGVEDFDKVWDWAVEYNFSSLGDYSGNRNNSPVLTENNLLKEIFIKDSFKEYSRNVILGGKWKQGEETLE